jgi:large conductance mechanosensitive channel
MLREFKAFLVKGNIVDLAVAFVLGVAFVTVVSTFTTVIINPLLGLVIGKSDLGSLDLILGKATIQYGLFLDSLISFVLVGFVLFLVVRVYNRVRAREDPTSKTCEFCKTDIAVDAVRCPNCTSQLQTS